MDVHTRDFQLVLLSNTATGGIPNPSTFYRNQMNVSWFVLLQKGGSLGTQEPHAFGFWKCQRKQQIASLPVGVQGFDLSHKQRLKQDCDNPAREWRASGLCSVPSPEAASGTEVGQMEFEGDRKNNVSKYFFYLNA